MQQQGENAVEIMSTDDVLCIILLGLLFAAIIYITCRFWLIPQVARRRRGKQSGLWVWIEDNLPRLFLVAWVYGFITYFTGTFVGSSIKEGGLWAIVSAVPMSVIHATEMFLGMSDISAIHEDRHNNPFFMALFDTSHFLAVTVSLCFVFKHLGYYMVMKYRLWKEAHGMAGHDDIYIMWGVSHKTIALAKSTIEHYKTGGDYIIVFVKTPAEDREDSQRLGFDRILNFVSMQEQEMRTIDSLGDSLVATSRHKLSNLELPDDESRADIIKGMLRMRPLAKIISKTSGTVHFFFFNDDRDRNINATANIIRDNLLADKRLIVCCMARRNAKTMWMEHYKLQHPQEQTDIKVIDPARLSVYQLKANVEYHPVNFVKWDKTDATPKSAFSSLVVGFHETGLDALNFLYEFGTFVGKDGSLSESTYTALDQNMDTYAGGFYVKAPALAGNKSVRLVKCAINDDKYWENIRSLLPGLNYTVIAVGNDDRGMDAAVDLCRAAYSADGRDAARRLTVFVKSYDEDNAERISRIANDLNKACRDRNINIVVFGKTDDIFTYSLIIDDKIMREAKTYNYYYENGSQKEGETEEKAKERVWRKVLKLDAKVPAELSLADIVNIERKRDQNISNSLHRHTKIRILEICHALPDPSPDIRMQMAMLEHARWVAASEVAGWQRMTYEQYLEYNKGKVNPSSQDPVRKLHTDICPWDEIRAWNKQEQHNTQAYDFKVLDVSLLLCKENKQLR